MKRLADEVEALVGPVLADEGLELIEVEFQRRGRHSVLRIAIDCEGGVTLAECERASKLISPLLDALPALTGRYFLEVSSPGIARPLTKREHYERFAGNEVVIRRTAGGGTIRGRLEGVEEDDVLVATADRAVVRVPLADIAKARLQPDIAVPRRPR